MVRGSCLCGSVAFELEGEITPIQYCHATRCRKASGAAASPELLTETKGLRWVRGADRITVYEAPVLSNPPAYRRAFCSGCGSPLPAEVPGTAYTLVNPGVLDDDPGTRVFRRAFVDQKAPWHEIADDLPRFGGRPPRPRRMD